MYLLFQKDPCLFTPLSTARISSCSRQDQRSPGTACHWWSFIFWQGVLFITLTNQIIADTSPSLLQLFHPVCPLLSEPRCSITEPFFSPHCGVPFTPKYYKWIIFSPQSFTCRCLCCHHLFWFTYFLSNKSQTFLISHCWAVVPVPGSVSYSAASHALWYKTFAQLHQCQQ